FGSYVGINNHMGSRFTGEVEAMAPVMRALRARGLVYLDSRTSSRSAAPTAAHEAGVPVVVRDVFIDHERTSEAVASALATVEEVARRNGRAIAIGHPRDVTIAALTRWLPRLEANGFRLVPLSAIVAELYPPGGPD
ncbi:MAG: divergent polysaccharide deacetylase family protein, partial [Alphaproteobacteria bacterium]